MATAALASSAVVGLAQSSAPLAGPEAADLRATRIPSFERGDPQRLGFGALAFRGGLELSSAHPSFGGLSSIRVAPDGARFLSVSDRGYWLRGRILYDRDAPVGIADAEIAPILGPDGQPLRRGRWYDSESLAESAGIVWVGYERVHGIMRFDYGKHGLLARGQQIATPARFKLLSANKGIEGLVAIPRGAPLGGALLAVSERGVAGEGDSIGFLIGGPAPGEFRIAHSDGFDVTDVALAPGGDLLILERFFSFFRGLRMRIRRIPLAQVKPGAVLSGVVLVEADLGDEIDNMEGLAVHVAASGEVVLTLVSDNNYSSLQRTLLLQFTLAGA